MQYREKLSNIEVFHNFNKIQIAQMDYFLHYNYVGKDNIYTNSAGITRYSPLAEWRHEDILAYIHYYDVKLPPIELKDDRNEHKHHNIAKRMVERGGRRDIFLGTRECQAFVEPCVFGEGESHYDDMPGEIDYGFMYHGITYADEAILPEDKGKMTVRFWRPVMKKGGIIEFIRPEACIQKRHIREMERKVFGKDNFTGLKEFTDEEVGE